MQSAADCCKNHEVFQGNEMRPSQPFPPRRPSDSGAPADVIDLDLSTMPMIETPVSINLDARALQVGAAVAEDVLTVFLTEQESSGYRLFASIDFDRGQCEQIGQLMLDFAAKSS